MVQYLGGLTITGPGELVPPRPGKAKLRIERLKATIKKQKEIILRGGNPEAHQTRIAECEAGILKCVAEIRRGRDELDVILNDDDASPAASNGEVTE